MAARLARIFHTVWMKAQQNLPLMSAMRASLDTVQREACEISRLAHHPRSRPRPRSGASLVKDANDDEGRKRFVAVEDRSTAASKFVPP
jgi:hypothetical protein